MSCFVSNYKIYIKTTNTCNLNCTHCYTGGIQPNVERFNKESIVYWLKGLVKAYPFIKDFEYAFHGGEPMLVPVSEMQEFMELSKDITPERSYAIQSNLVFKLTEERVNFLKSLNYVGTSWDYDIRFDSKRSEEIWEDNVKTLVQEGINLHSTISMSRRLVNETKPIDIIIKMHKLGIKNILFERLTPSGTAKDNPEIFPNSRELNGYFLDMWNQSIENRTWEFIHNLFFEPTAQTFLNRGPVDGARRCRGCEKQILTFNSDGTIGGCADGALENVFGTVHQDPMAVLGSKNRYKTIAKEQEANPNCLDCDVYKYCYGDCYKQKHDEFGCMAPKGVMQKIASSIDRELLKKFASPQF